MISNAAVTAPPASIRLWQFTGIRVTTYNGTRGDILGPWATSRTDRHHQRHSGRSRRDERVNPVGGRRPELQRLAPPPFMTKPGYDPVDHLVTRGGRYCIVVRGSARGRLLDTA